MPDALQEPRMQSVSLAPSEDAETMTDFMLDQRDLRREILAETINSAEKGRIKESGRTVCGPETILPPHVRFPRAVELQRCPVSDGAGIMHTHVTHDELFSPQHSIPDVANVIFEDNIVASMIVGLETSEILKAPEDSDEGHKAFENAFGISVDSPRDVQQAIDQGQIESFQAVRRRLQRELDPLITDHDTAFPELQERLSGVTLPASAPLTARSHAHGEGQVVACGPAQRLAASQAPIQPDNTAESFRRRQSRVGDELTGSVKQAGVPERIWDEVVGSTITLTIRSLLF